MNRTFRTFRSSLRSFFRALGRRRRLDAEMSGEIDFHLDARADDLVAGGMAPQAAARQARIEFGPVVTHKDGMRASLGLRWFDDLTADLAYAVRILSRSPGFTLIAVSSLALAIGANTVIFSFANQVLYTRLGVPHAEQLRVLAVKGDDKTAIHAFWGYGGTEGTTAFSWPVYQQLRSRNHALEDIFAFKNLGTVSLTVNGTATVAQADLVSGNFYGQMRLRPQLGRAIDERDDGAPGSGNVVLISDGLWHRAFGASPDVLGKVVTVNLQQVTIIGVNPAGLKSPAGIVRPSPELILPLSMMPALHPATGHFDTLGPDLWWLNLMARAKPGVSDRQAEAELDVVLNAAMRGTMHINPGETIPHLKLKEGARGDIASVESQYAKPITILLSLAGLVLLLACANIANLMLSRATFRQREMSVRMALGAGRGRIIRQVLTESLLIAAVGGAGGLVLGYLGRGLLPWLTSTSWEGGELFVSFDWRVFGFASAATLVTGILFGVLPAWSLTRTEINSELKAGSRSATRARKAWSGKAIVAFQVALSTMLVISAVLFLRTLVNLNSIDPGFRAEGLSLFDIAPPASRYKAPGDIALHQRLERELAAIPGVEGVTAANIPLVAGAMWVSGFHPEGAPESGNAKKNLPDNAQESNLSDVGQDFFKVMQIPILVGRAFNAQDTATSVPVSVINESLAKKYFPGVNPIGRRFRMDTTPDAPWLEVVGICADTRYNDMHTLPGPIHFDLYRQNKEVDGVTYVVRSSLDGEALLRSVRRVVQHVDPDLPVDRFRTQKQQIAESMQEAVLFATLTAGFGVLALALACVGIYGIMAYTVSQRTSEIGIRLALGAVRGQIRTMVLGETGWLAGIGVACGIVPTLLAVRLVKSQMYGLNPGDPLTFVGVAVLLLAVALLAAWVPAYRASRVEPMVALRHDG